MEQITLRVPENTLESLEGEADEHGRSRSEHIREVLESRNEVDELRAEHEREVADLRDKIEDLERELEQRDARLDDLRRQLQAANAKDERVQELATYVEEERRVEQRWRQAGLGTKLKWRLFGMPADAETA